MLTKDLRYKPTNTVEKIKSQLYLSDDENLVFDLSMRDKSIVEMANILKCSESTINRRLKCIRLKLENFDRGK